MSMQIHSCNFVLASELFDGCNELREEFSNNAKDLTWGGANRTLVDADHIMDILDGAGCADEGSSTEPQFKTLFKRVSTLPDGFSTYVDLEN